MPLNLYKFIKKLNDFKFLNIYTDIFFNIQHNILKKENVITFYSFHLPSIFFLIKFKTKIYKYMLITIYLLTLKAMNYTINLLGFFIP